MMRLMSVEPRHRLSDSDAYPPQLLADYVSIWRRKPPSSLRATAIRTRSLAARRILAHAAAAGSASLGQLLDAARGDRAERELLDHERLDRRALADLGQVIALQEILPEDPADGMALLDLALELLGPEGIPASHQRFHAQLAYHLGDRARAAELLSIYESTPDLDRALLELDLSNPFETAAPAQSASWLRRLEALLPDGPLLLAGDRDLPPFDRLASARNRKVGGSQPISVIVTCFEPGDGLLTAVRSLVEQSWEDLEILVVDDGSPPQHRPLLDRCATLDDRIRLIRLDANGGTYAARNAGLDASSGELVTFLDSDDWAHPRRLEEQAEPLLADPDLLATTSRQLRATDRLTFTDPHRNVSVASMSSLLFRRNAVLGRVGYFDRVRKGADAEYLGRLAAAFGRSAIKELDAIHLLCKRQARSLSYGDFRRYWWHPARAAYRSAFHLWHERIEAGVASSYLDKRPPERPFPAPRHMTAREARSTGGAIYDVVLAGDWRKYGGPGKSMVEQIKALTRAGMRVGIMHMEACRFMVTSHRPLCSPVQTLINDGVVDHVLPGAAHDVELLMIRYPPVLQFPPAEPSRLRVRQAAIVANQAPAELDGTDLRYVPAACTRAAEALFGVRPLWIPVGPRVRESLEAAGMGAPDLAPVDAPPTINSRESRLERVGFRSTMPVLGRHSRDNPMKWPAARDALLRAYPASSEFDVRVMGGTKSARALLDGIHLPPNWLAYDYDEIDVGCFLYQLDFWVYFPHPMHNEASPRAALEALASGCVVIMPHVFSSTFGNAALYRSPGEVQETVLDYYAEPDLYLEQSRLGQETVLRRFSEGTVLDLVSSLREGRASECRP